VGLALWSGSPGLSGIGAVTPGTTPIVGGTDKRVLFDDAGVVGEAQYLTYDKTARTLTIPSSTGNVPQFILGPDTGNGFGIGNANSGSEAIFYFNGSGISGSWVESIGLTANGVVLASTGILAWTNNSTNVRTTTDLFLRRDAADTLAQRNGTTAQVERIYNTYTDASNYERAFISWTKNANRLSIGSEAAGTGSQRPIDWYAATHTFYYGTTPAWDILSTGNFVARSDNTLDIGASGASRPRNVYVGSSITAGAWMKITPVAVASLPSAATAGNGARAHVTDALAPVFGATVANGGAVSTPVYSDGTNWKVG
jgi:hypothetical protein